MNKKIKSQFRVKCVNDKEICLYDMNKGLTVFVESIYNQKYNKTMKNKISKLESNDIINASLESQNILCTVWIFDEL